MKYFTVFAFVLLTVLAFVSADKAAEAIGEESMAQCMCPRILDPVCGSDAVTYPNPCEFLCAQRNFARIGRTILLARAGRC